MSDILLKDKDGVQQTYSGIKLITAPAVGGGVAEYSEDAKDLKDNYFHIHKNLCPSNGTIVPCVLHVGDVISISFERYSLPTDTNIKLVQYDDNDQEVDYWSAYQTKAPRVITITKESTRLGYSGTTNELFMTVKGDTYCDYEPYLEDDESYFYEVADIEKTKFANGGQQGGVGDKIWFCKSGATNINRAHTVDRLYLSAGMVLTSSNMDINLMRVNNDDIILSDDGWNFPSDTVADSGYYYIVFADHASHAATINCNNINLSFTYPATGGNNTLLTAVSQFSFDSKCKTVAHTGQMLAKYPRNSREGFLAAAQCDTVWGIETDLQTTSDGVIVCLHDPYNGRLTTNPRGASTNSIVKEETYQWMYDNVRLSFDYVGSTSEYRICTFEEYLRICKEYGKVPVIDLKEKDVTWAAISGSCPAGSTTVVHNYSAIIDLIRKYGLEDVVIFTAMTQEFLTGMRQVSQKAILMFDGYTLQSAQWILAQPWGANKRAGQSLYMTYALTAAEVKAYHENGLIICTWTPTPDNYSGALAQRNLGVDFAVCDLIPDFMNIERQDEAKADRRNAIGAVHVSTGTTAPTTSTPATMVGDMYINTANNNTIYMCVAISGETYTWKAI